jgi:hypothetical protein
VKYLLLIYSNPKVWAHPVYLHQDEDLSADKQAAMLAQGNGLLQEIAESGELLTAGPLAEPRAAKTIRLVDDELATLDGPYAEAKEQLAGYFVLETETEERAVEIARRFPDAAFGAVELRPIMDLSGQEM